MLNRCLWSSSKQLGEPRKLRHHNFSLFRFLRSPRCRVVVRSHRFSPSRSHTQPAIRYLQNRGPCRATAPSTVALASSTSTEFSTAFSMTSSPSLLVYVSHYGHRSAHGSRAARALQIPRSPLLWSPLLLNGVVHNPVIIRFMCFRFFQKGARRLVGERSGRRVRIYGCQGWVWE